MSSDKFSQEQLDVLAKVEKLMRLAARNPNENEALAASAKATEMSGGNVEPTNGGEL
jgi:hypothetical protein